MRRLLLPLVLALAACSPTAPVDAVPSGAVEFPAHSVYLLWWKEVEVDAGVLRSMDRVRYFRVPTKAGFWYDPQIRRWVNGLWSPDGKIYLADRDGELNEGLVKHELLHEILRGDSGHRNPLFATYDALPACYVGKCEAE
jgi:hypothetical protein